jgi:membrane-bound lytic murein transglycosylase B
MIASAMVALTLSAAPAIALAETQPFPVWLDGVREEALAQGISPGTLDQAFAGLEPIARVIELDRRQLEGRITYQEYRDRLLSKDRIDQGRRFMREHEALLERVAADYGVQPRFIVALWGIETSYGARTGGYPVIAALATLAYDGRRADFFRRELLNALRIVDQGNIGVDAMFGSWAGAMGQSQFMPSSYVNNAIDYDGDGRRDIWNSLPDVFASIAHYLSGAGWDAGDRWGREVRLPSRNAQLRTGLEHKAPLATWAELGVRSMDGDVLPTAAMTASLLDMGGGGGPNFLVYNNFRTLMVWNRSTYFALSVGLISDKLRES